MGQSGADSSIAMETPPGLRYVNDTERGISRHRRGDHFTYRDVQSRTVRDRDTLARIKALAVPPAWTDVWICPTANGHIQAVGRDARGRKQYRYHAKWREHRDMAKYEHMLAFARVLPAIRARVQDDLARQGLPLEKVTAAIVGLLESTLIRVGNEDYARDNQSYGLTTLREQHIDVKGSELRFRFRGKSGKSWNLKLSDRRIAKVVRACQDLPGQALFQYRDDDGEIRGITSSDVNDYLRAVSEQDITAKDFRTWAGTVLAALALKEFQTFDSMALAKRNIKAAIERVAERLGNTPTICRKCYVHPEIVTTYLDGVLATELERKARAEFQSLANLRPEEAAVLALLSRRLGVERRKRAAATRPRRPKTEPRRKAA